MLYIAIVWSVSIHSYSKTIIKKSTNLDCVTNGYRKIEEARHKSNGSHQYLFSVSNSS